MSGRYGASLHFEFLPMDLSKAAAKFLFSTVEKDRELTFKALKGESKASSTL
ncbi:MAG: hypothetical protein V4727_08245 [Verrucomicrobiota bacterium]